MVSVGPTGIPTPIPPIPLDAGNTPIRLSPLVAKERLTAPSSADAKIAFLMTSPGSGKTTTLATLINYINENFPYHIITIEDPIEYLFRHGKSIVNQREIGEDVDSFADALRAALREDPNVILVGEMRDLETIEIALRAAET
jgi:Tfp pilus assembly pilus retraction ATPase PilT